MDLEGRRRIAEGREAEIYEWEEGVVLKLYRAGFGLEWEEAALAAVEGAGGPAPRPLGRHEVAGRPGLLIARVDGVDMLTMLDRTPWRFLSFARRLARAHAELHAVTAPDTLPATKALLAERIGMAPLEANLRDFALEHAAALPDGDRLCHGDFHPGNVLVTRSGISVIDWPLASRGHPSADHARTALLMAIGDPPPVSPLFRALITFGRRWFGRAYARTYRRLAPVDPGIVRHARIAHTAARLSEGIEVEIPKLLSLLRRARDAET